MKYEEMQAILRRIDGSVGGRWGVMSDGLVRREVAFREMPEDGRWWLERYRPWQASNEAAPGLTIGTDANTEPIGRLSGYLMDVRGNADLIVHARDDMRILVAEIVRLNAMLVTLGKEAPEAYEKLLDESGDDGNWLASDPPKTLPAR